MSSIAETAQKEVFHKEEDFAAFVGLMEEANERLPMRVVAWRLLGNHFHAVLWPHADGDLSRWTQWLLTSHVRRYHRRYHTIWQQATAERLGPEASLRPRGRPRIIKEK